MWAVMTDDIKAALELARETLAGAACCNSIGLGRIEWYARALHEAVATKPAPGSNGGK